MKLSSSAIPSSETFQTNQRNHLDALETIREAAEAARLGGGERARRRHEDRGKMLPRRRIRTLLDPDSPFLEIGATAAHNMYDNAAPSGGVIAGIGRVHGIECMIVCNDATVKGGTYYPM
ncbi:MAG: carboxyl transferase domain-containing protein, partial [Thalassovita sp.]